MRRWVANLGGHAVDVSPSFPGGLPWLLVPGLMWRRQRRTGLGSAVLAIWAVLMVIHIFSLNQGSANTAAMLASALHAISAAAVLAVLYPHWQGFSRLWKTSLFATLLVFVIYSIGFRNVVLPLAQRVTTQGTTVMIHSTKWFPSRPWAQGEWVAYRLSGGFVNLDRILAGSGQTIRFHQDSFEVNGRFFERVSPQMPTSGDSTMDAGTYFIWPTEAAYTHGGDQTELLLRLTEINETDILGRPYQHWFWKSSALEALKPVQPPSL